MITDIKGEKVLSLIDFDNNKVLQGINIGNGPGEVLSFSSPQIIDNKFYICDINRKRINQIDTSNDNGITIKESIDIDFKSMLFSINYQQSYLTATGILEEGWIASFTKDGGLLSTIDFPKFDEMNNTPKFELSMLYLSTHMSSNPDNKKMFAATQDFGVISFFNNNNSILEEYKQIKYYGQQYSLREGGGVILSKDSKASFCDLDSDNKYIYALYSGRTNAEYDELSHHCEHLLVYDWDGNPVKHYMLEIPLFSMKYDKEKNSIQGIAYNPEGVFVEYEL